MATAQVSGDQKIYLTMCDRLEIKFTKIQQPNAYRFLTVARKSPPPPPQINWG